MNKGIRLIKRLMALLLVLIFCIESLASVVSDNDGSAFITKAEFDSLKNNFQSQIDQYNTSIDSKIDGAIASYLAGISVSKSTMKAPYCVSNYTMPINFHGKNDMFGVPRQLDDGTVRNAYNMNIKWYSLMTPNSDGYVGARFRKDTYLFDDNVFEFVVKAKWSDTLHGWQLNQWAENGKIKWNWIKSYNSWTTSPYNKPYYYYAYKSGQWWFGITGASSLNIGGTRGTQYEGWTSATGGDRTFDEINVSTQPAWSYGNLSLGNGCDEGCWSEIDDCTWETKVKHFWAETCAKYEITRKFDILESLPSIIQARAWKQKYDASATHGSLYGIRNNDVSKLSLASLQSVTDDGCKAEWGAFYGPSYVGYHGYASTHERYNQDSLIGDNELFYKSYNNEIYDLRTSPILDVFDEKVKEVNFKVKLDDADVNADSGKLYMSTSSWKSLTPSAGVRLPMFKNNSMTAVTELDIVKGEETKITIKNDFNKGDIVFFKIVPNDNSKRVIINEISDYIITTE